MNPLPVINQHVATPNGEGIVQGRMFEGGALAILVRHKTPVVVSRGGHPAIRTATTLYVYSQEEVTS